LFEDEEIVQYLVDKKIIKFIENDVEDFGSCLNVVLNDGLVEMYQKMKVTLF
jgi:hypothetical protein